MQALFGVCEGGFMYAWEIKTVVGFMCQLHLSELVWKFMVAI